MITVQLLSGEKREVPVSKLREYDFVRQLSHSFLVQLVSILLALLRERYATDARSAYREWVQRKLR